jgi:hypothetical protein
MTNGPPLRPGDFGRRGLLPWMLEQFVDPGGILHPVLVAVREDPQQRLDLQIRCRYVDIYYCGAKLMVIAQSTFSVLPFWPGSGGSRSAGLAGAASS